MSDFAETVETFIAKAKVKSETVRRVSEFELLRRIVKDTPVDTGRARGAWEIDTSTPVTRIKNNVDYILKLEFGGYPNPPERGTAIKGGGYEIKSISGYSKQAPQGMARKNVRDWDKIVELNSKVF